MDKSKYPDNWDEIAFEVKEAAGWKCQREGCEKQCRRPREKFDTHKRTLTVAHLNHIEMDCSPENLRAFCAPCHLRYDAKHHAKNAAATRLKKRMKNQRQLFE